MKRSILVLFLIIANVGKGWCQFNNWKTPASNYIYNFGGATAANSPNFLEIQNITTFTESVTASNPGWLPAPASGIGFMHVAKHATVPNNGRFDLLPSAKPYSSMQVRLPYGGVTKMGLVDMGNATNVCRFSVNVNTGNISNERGIMRIGLGNYDAGTTGSFTNTGNFSTNVQSDIFSVIQIGHTANGIDLKIRSTKSNGSTVTYQTIKENALALNTSYEIELFVNNSLYSQTYRYSNNDVVISSGNYHIWVNGEQVFYADNQNFPSAVSGSPELLVNKKINAVGFHFVSGDEDFTKSPVFTLENIQLNYAHVEEPVYNSSPIYNYPVFPLALADFYNSLDYDNIPALNPVKQAALDEADYSEAARELKNYFLTNSNFAQTIYNVKNLVQSNVPQPSAELYLQRTYTFQGVTYTFPDGIDWLYNPTGINGIEYNQEWVVNTVRFRSLPVIVNAYRATKDERFAAEAIYMMLDFIKKFPVPSDNAHPGLPEGFDRFMYSQLSVSSRVESTIYGLFSVLESSVLSDEAFVTILQGIYNHLLRMEKFPYLNYHNMGVADAKVLHKASLSFPEFKKSVSWVTWGIERALDQMQGVVYPDGVEKELCPRYHQGVMGSFLEFMTNSNLSGNQIPQSFVNRLEGMAEFLVKISRPDGNLPAFNEMVQSSSSSSTVRSKVRSIANAINNEGALRWFESKGSAGTIPSYKSTALDWAGYYVMRSGWGEKDNHMVIKAGPYGTAHQQEDKLSFELFANGELFLVDPGFYTYNTQSIWRKYYQSSMAHNTVVPDRLSQYRYGRKALYENLTQNDALWISNEKYDFLSAEYNNGYADYQYLHTSNPHPLLQIKHQRDIMFIKPGVWLVLDWMNPDDNNPHLYEALFQSQKAVETTNNAMVVKGNQSDLHIIPFTKNSTVLNTEVISHQTEPFRRGLIFNADTQENLPLPTGVVSQTATGNTVQAYFIIPGNQTPVTAHILQPITVPGGVGGKLITADGLKLSFIAQKTSGQQISGGGMSTDGRLKVVLEDTNEIFEIEGSTLPEFVRWDKQGSNYTYDFSGSRRVSSPVMLLGGDFTSNYIDESNFTEPGWLPAPSSGTTYLRIGQGTSTQPQNGKYELDLSSDQKKIQIRIPSGGITSFSAVGITNASEVVRFSTTVNFGSLPTLKDKALMRIAIGNQGTGTTFTTGSNLNNSDVESDVFAAIGFEYNATTDKVTLKVRRNNTVGYTDVGASYFNLNTDYNVEIIGNNSAVSRKYNYGAITDIELQSRTYHIYINGVQIDYSGNLNFPGAAAIGSTPELIVDKVINALRIWVLSGDADVTKNPVITISNIRMDYGKSNSESSLPVSLVSFTTQKQNNNVKLNWITASEQNNSHFDILRSSDGKEFYSITKIPGAVNSNQIQHYSYIDKNPFLGVNYYKLKQVDFDGASTESGIQTIFISQAIEGFTVYQDRNSLMVSIYSPTSLDGSITLSDISGKILMEKKIMLQTGYTKLDMEIGLTSGVYVANLIIGDKVKTVKFLYGK